MLTFYGDSSNGYPFGGNNYYPAIINNLAGATYDLQGDGGFQAVYMPGYPADNAINNAGLFKKSSGTGTSVVGSFIPFTNTGTVEVDTGTLEFDGAFNNNGVSNVAVGATLNLNAGGNSNGVFNVETGGTVNLANGNFILAPFTQLNGAGYYGMASGSLYGTINSKTFQWSGGVFTGAVACGSTLNWTGGSLGNATIDTTATLKISGGASKSIGENITLTNRGTIVHSESAMLTFYGDSSNGYPFGGNNYYPAIINNLAGATYDLQGDGGFQAVYMPGYPADNAINNAGLFKKSSGTGTSVVGSFIPFTNTGTVEVDSGTLEFDDAFTQITGTTNLNGGDITLGTVGNFVGGNLTGNGTITGNISNSGGIVSPGHSPGKIAINGDYTQGSGGILLIELAGSSADQFDVLDIQGTAFLDGTLEISFLNGYFPAVGDNFNILDFNAISGNFSSIQVLGAPGYQFTPTFSSNGLTLTTSVVPAPEPASLTLLAAGLTALLTRRRRS